MTTVRMTVSETIAPARGAVDLRVTGLATMEDALRETHGVPGVHVIVTGVAPILDLTHHHFTKEER